MEGNFKNATLPQYIDWLKGYFKRGGQPTHYYDYSFSKAGFLVVSGTFGLDGECGARSKKIIVLKGGKKDPRKGAFGHNKLYFMDGFKAISKSGEEAPFVPIYNDDVFLTLDLDEFIQAQVTQDSKFRRHVEKHRRFKR